MPDATGDMEAHGPTRNAGLMPPPGMTVRVGDVAPEPATGIGLVPVSRLALAKLAESREIPPPRLPDRAKGGDLPVEKLIARVGDLRAWAPTSFLLFLRTAPIEPTIARGQGRLLQR